MPLEEKYLLDIDDMAKCSRCQAIKPKSEFYANKKRWNGIRNDCKVCSVKAGNKDYQLRPSRQRTGWTQEDLKEARGNQNDLCAICKKPEQGGVALSRDHDHATGKKRELLCRNCNLLLGYAKDDPAILHAASEYLFRHSIIPIVPVLDATATP